MSASGQQAGDLRRPGSVVPQRVKQSLRAILNPVVRLAMALHLTANGVTVIGLAVTIVASVLVGTGWLLIGAALLAIGSVLDAVDGALARAQGGGTPFGAFFDSTLDRSGEAILYIGIGAWMLGTQPEPMLPVLLVMVALAGSFLVSYSHARAQGIGLAADVGLAPRTERLVLAVVGVALAGLGWTVGLIGALVIIAALTIVTVVQRIRHVWNLTQASSTLDSKEN